jgi:hypothetical protein
MRDSHVEIEAISETSKSLNKRLKMSLDVLKPDKDHQDDLLPAEESERAHTSDEVCFISSDNLRQ